MPSVTTKTEPRASDGMGNGLFATSDIKVGEDVLHGTVPFVAVLDTLRLEDTCSGCFGKRQMETDAELKACTGCRVVKYCDRVSFMTNIFFICPFAVHEGLDCVSNSIIVSPSIIC